VGNEVIDWCHSSSINRFTLGVVSTRLLELGVVPTWMCEVAERRGCRAHADAMSAQQQQAIDSLYALDNVLSINITVPCRLECGAHRGADGGRCNVDPFALQFRAGCP
jgi:hypothetical protein